eukprot:jgi/Botrbrau1/13672/Bobra.0378s0006.1
MAANGELKHLSFVKEQTTALYSKVAELYAASKGYVPGPINGVLAKAEAMGATVFDSIADNGEKALSGLDSRVDGAVSLVSKLYGSASDELTKAVEIQHNFHAANLRVYKDAREAYLKKIEEVVVFLKKAGMGGTAKYAVESLSVHLEHAKQYTSSYLPMFENGAEVVLAQVNQAWAALTKHPQVVKVLENFKPTVELAQQKYLEAHNAITSSQLYHQAVQNSTAVLNKLQATAVYQTAANKLYPTIAPYADPALGRITASHYYQVCVDHLKPATVNGKA